MPLRPLGKKVIGKLIEKGMQYEGRIVLPFGGEKKPTYAMKVVGIGEGCTEVFHNAVVILPESGWSFVKLKEEDGEVEEYVAIREELILAIVE